MVQLSSTASPGILAACANSGERYRARAIEEAAQHYDRHRHLARIVPLPAQTIADTSRAGTKAIVEKLETVSRNLAEAASRSHWSYDTNRHIAVLGALQAERASLARLEDEDRPAA